MGGLHPPTSPAFAATLDTDQIPKGSKGLKATTVTRIAAPAPTIPLTVDTFQTPKAERVSDDSYEDRHPDPHYPCDCSAFHKGAFFHRIIFLMADEHAKSHTFLLF